MFFFDKTGGKCDDVMKLRVFFLIYRLNFSKTTFEAFFEDFFAFAKDVQGGEGGGWASELKRQKNS